MFSMRCSNGIRNSEGALVAVAALALTLAGCGSSGDVGAEEASAPETTTTQHGSDTGGNSSEDDDEDSSGGSRNAAAIGGDPEPSAVTSFDLVSLGPMGEPGSGDTGAAPEALAETVAQISQVEPAEVQCDGTLEAGTAVPVSCTIASIDETYTAYPVLGGHNGEEPYQLIVPGELDEVTASTVVSPMVSMHYGPSDLFLGDAAQSEGDALANSVQMDLDNNGVEALAERCDPAPEGGEGPVVCEGTRGDESVQITVHPAVSGSGDAVSVMLVTIPA